MVAAHHLKSMREVEAMRPEDEALFRDADRRLSIECPFGSSYRRIRSRRSTCLTNRSLSACCCGQNSTVQYQATSPRRAGRVPCPPSRASSPYRVPEERKLGEVIFECFDPSSGQRCTGRRNKPPELVHQFSIVDREQGSTTEVLHLALD